MMKTPLASDKTLWSAILHDEMYVQLPKPEAQVSLFPNDWATLFEIQKTWLTLFSGLEPFRKTGPE